MSTEEKEEQPNPVNTDSVQQEEGQATAPAKDDNLVSIGAEVDAFIEHIDALESTVNLTMVVIQAVHASAHDVYQKFIDEKCKTVDEAGEESILVERDVYGEFKKLEKQVIRTERAQTIVSRSLLVALVSSFDSFIGRLLRILYSLRPELLNASERSLSFTQLAKFNSIEAAKEYVLEKEIETVLRKSHTEQFDWLEKKFDVKLREKFPAWPTFVEITERRNLFVHTNGVVSSQYLNVCNEHGVDVNNIKVGDELDITPPYFNAAYETMFEIGVKLSQVLWRKVRRKEVKQADNHLNKITYELLLEEKYALARVLLDFAILPVMKHLNDESRRTIIVNRAQAYKWLGDEAAAREIVSKEDWSATSNEFKLAEAVLLNNFDAASSVMKKIGAEGYPSKIDYKEWPLFKEFRKSNEFLRAYEEVFGEPFPQIVKAERTEEDKTTASLQLETSEQVT